MKGDHWKSAITAFGKTAPLSYAITGGDDAELFSINPITGDVQFKVAPNARDPLDADGNNIYDVIVQASLGDGQLRRDLDTQRLAITVSANSIGNSTQPSPSQPSPSQPSPSQPSPSQPSSGLIMQKLSPLSIPLNESQILGDDGDNFLLGTEGNDVIQAKGGSDAILAGAGNDIVIPTDTVSRGRG